MRGHSLEQRIELLERRLRNHRRIAGLIAMVLVAALVAGQGLPENERPRTITAHRLTIVDDQGRPRIVIGQDAKDSQRRSRAAGIHLLDDAGNERGGFSTMDDGSVVLGIDAPVGAGAPMRDRIGLVVGAKGQASIMLIDNQTRGVVQLASDGDGGGGVQFYKWETDEGKVHVKTLTYDGEVIETVELGEPN